MDNSQLVTLSRHNILHVLAVHVLDDRNFDTPSAVDAHVLQDYTAQLNYDHLYTQFGVGLSLLWNKMDEYFYP